MQNIYWFIFLGIAGTASAGFTIYKKRHSYKMSTLITFYLCISGFAWICEFIVLGIFNSYSYKTGVVADTWGQNLLGHLLLNTTLYPSAAIVTVTSKRRKLTCLFYMALLTLIEYLFIKLGLYEHHWWRYYMTTMTVGIILIIAIIWFDKIKAGCRGYQRAVTFFFIALLIVHIPAPILLLLNKQYYHLEIITKIFGNLYLSSIIFIFAYHLLESFELVLLTCIFKKRYLKMLAFVVSITFQCIFAARNVLIFEDGWNIVFALIAYEVFIGAFLLIEKHTLKKQ